MLALRLTLVAVLVATPAFAGRGKIIDLIRSAPKGVKPVADALAKEKKDGNKRSALSLVLDDMLRAQPEVNDPSAYDQLTHLLLQDVLTKMSEPTEAFSSENAPDKFNPRADVLFRGAVKVKPGRVSKSFNRSYVKKPQGKRIDRAYRDQPASLAFSVAESDAEFDKWVTTEGWGLVVHTAHLDSASGVARIGCTFVSNGTKEAPGGHFERPSWVAFYRQKGANLPFQPLAIEPVTATDWREQPINVMPPKAEPNELSLKLYLAVWMEQVRALPTRPTFFPQEQALFSLTFDGGGTLDAEELPWLQPYRDSDSKLVRAAAELKVAELGGEWKPDAVFLLSKTLKHPVVRPLLEEQLKKAPQGWKPPPLPPGVEAAAAPLPDAGTK